MSARQESVRTARGRTLAALCTGALVLGGCGLGNGLYNVSLPGGADLGDHPYSVTAQFADALDLVPQAGVKVNDVAVGRVTSIRLDRSAKLADVRVEVNGDVRLPANATASILQTSLLGEKYVALSAPLGVPASGRLMNGALIPQSRTTDGVEVEQVFGALSLVLNGGGIDQLNGITRELNTFAHGHESTIRQWLAASRTMIAGLNAHKKSITDTLDALSLLSGTLRRNDAAIARVLRGLAPGLGVLADQRKQLIGALTALNRLSGVTVDTLRQNKEDVLADLRELGPILGNLAAAGSALPRSLQVAFTYPFPDQAVGGIKGDYLNTYITMALRTPGGRVVPIKNYALPRAAGTVSKAGGTTQKAGGTTSGASPASAPPSGLLPATSSAIAGLPGTLTMSPAGSGGGG